MSVLITNAEYTVCLAIMKSLGRKDIDVTVSTHINKPTPLSFYSKYYKNKVFYPSIENGENEFIQKIISIVKNNNYDVLLPLRESVILPISKHRNKFAPYVKIPIAEHEVLEKADDKAQTLKIAEDNDIPIPKTYFIEKTSDIDKIKNEIIFPVIIKPYKGESAKGVTYAYSEKELKDKYMKVREEFGPSMIQEYVSGTRYTVAALFNEDSKPRRVCVHKGIRENPITGGPQIFAETVENPEVLNHALKLLKAMNYYGMAEVEFIADERDKKIKLMEINPRFYDSIWVPIASGVDFPYLLYKMAMDGDIKPSFDYKTGIKCRYLLGDMRHLISVMKGVKTPKYKLGRLQTLLNFLKFHEDDAHYVFSLDDPKPAIMDFIQILSKKLRNNK